MWEVVFTACVIFLFSHWSGLHKKQLNYHLLHPLIYSCRERISATGLYGKHTTHNHTIGTKHPTAQTLGCTQSTPHRFTPTQTSATRHSAQTCSHTRQVSRANKQSAAHTLTNPTINIECEIVIRCNHT